MGTPEHPVPHGASMARLWSGRPRYSGVSGLRRRPVAAGGPGLRRCRGGRHRAALPPGGVERSEGRRARRAVHRDLCGVRHGPGGGGHRNGVEPVRPGRDPGADPGRRVRDHDPRVVAGPARLAAAGTADPAHGRRLDARRRPGRRARDARAGRAGDRRGRGRDRRGPGGSLGDQLPRADRQGVVVGRLPLRVGLQQRRFLAVVQQPRVVRDGPVDRPADHGRRAGRRVWGSRCCSRSGDSTAGRAGGACTPRSPC